MLNRSTRNAVFSVKYHVIWWPKYRRGVLGGAAERRLTQIIAEAVTVGGAPLEVVRRYVENQKLAAAEKRATAA